MKITVDISDHYIEEGHLDLALSNAIKQGIVTEIIRQTREQTQKTIYESVTATINESINKEITAAMSDFIDTGIIVVSGKEVMIKDHMLNIFQNNHGWNNPYAKMEALAKKFGEELKLQYNSIFATKIVLSMQSQGFLKEDMARLLLDGNKTK